MFRIVHVKSLNKRTSDSKCIVEMKIQKNNLSLTLHFPLICS